MSYIYVSDIYDDHYVSPPPSRTLSRREVPEEEIEIRDILVCWYETGFVPLQHSMQLQTTFLDSKTTFERLTRTLNTLVKYKAYFFAVKRVISMWDRDSLECRYLTYLLNKHSQGSAIIDRNIQL
ncbi:hypothetical protein [Vibrio cionasavignyae]|uniref:hypothetical protein n=1 Tax=Vibrio cionasavignyae TaxID=2910252 RepID=UPI003D1113D8